MSYRVVNGKLYPLQPIENYKSEEKANSTSDKQSFDDILKNKLNKDNNFVISKHASDRLASRNISFNQQDMNNINEGINKAEEKGGNNSVIVYKDVALVTSIKNRTIITAVDKNSNKDNVFTNIDSVVLL